MKMGRPFRPQDSIEVPHNFLDRLLGGPQLMLPVKIAYNGKSFTIPRALFDTGASGYLFMSVSFARKIKQTL